VELELEWDEVKRQDTLRERRLDFADVVDFEFDTANTIEDRATDYGEVRQVSTGYLHGRLCVLCWTRRGARVKQMTARKRAIPRLPDDLPPLTDEDGEVRELTAEDFKHFHPMREVFPELVEAFERARGQRGAQKAPTKEHVSIRLSRDVLAHFRAGGPGWQSRINEVLADYVKREGK